MFVVNTNKKETGLSGRAVGLSKILRERAACFTRRLKNLTHLARSFLPPLGLDRRAIQASRALDPSPSRFLRGGRRVHAKRVLVRVLTR